MLVRADAENIEKIKGALEKSAEFNVRLSALINAYSCDKPFFNVFHDNFKTIVGELEGNFYIGETDGINFSEIAEFLKFYPSFRSVIGKKETIEKIGFKKSGETYNLLILDKKSFAKSDVKIDSNPSLKDVYDMLKANESNDFKVGEFMPWYADMSHRIRHGAAKAFILEENNKKVSCLLVSAFSEKAALVSGVTTVPEERHKGYAKKLLSAVLSDDLFKTRTAVIECEQRLLDFYKSFGFKKLGEIELIEL